MRSLALTNHSLRSISVSSSASAWIQCLHTSCMGAAASTLLPDRLLQLELSNNITSTSTSSYADSRPPHPSSNSCSHHGSPDAPRSRANPSTSTRHASTTPTPLKPHPSSRTPSPCETHPLNLTPSSSNSSSSSYNSSSGSSSSSRFRTHTSPLCHSTSSSSSRRAWLPYTLSPTRSYSVASAATVGGSGQGLGMSSVNTADALQQFLEELQQETQVSS